MWPQPSWDDLSGKIGYSKQGFLKALDRGDMPISRVIALARELKVSPAEVVAKLAKEEPDPALNMLSDTTSPEYGPKGYIKELEEYNQALQREVDVLRKMVKRFQGGQAGAGQVGL